MMDEHTVEMNGELGLKGGNTAQRTQQQTAQQRQAQEAIENDHLRPFIGEILGTFILVTFGLGSCAQTVLSTYLADRSVGETADLSQVAGGWSAICSAWNWVSICHLCNWWSEWGAFKPSNDRCFSCLW